MKILDEKRVRDNVERRINEDIASGRVGGASVIVKQCGRIVYKGCLGKSNDSGPLTDKALFRLASLTKPVTTAAILKQIDMGLVSIDDPLEKYIPEYAEMEIGALNEHGEITAVGKATEKVRILHLLNHTSGVGSLELGNKLFSELSPKEKTDLKSISEAYSKLPLAFNPGSAQAYSPLIAFDLVARVVEITSGMTYDNFLKKEILDPLGMVNTAFVPTDEQWGNMVHFHDFRGDKAIFLLLEKSHTMSDLPLTYFCGGASLFSSVEDYSKFAEMLLSEGKTPSGEQLISRDMIKSMRTPTVSEQIMPGNQKWGLGVRVITDDSYRLLPKGAFGWSGAYGAHMWVDPENQITAVYMKNSLYDGGSGALTAAHFEEDVYF